MTGSKTDESGTQTPKGLHVADSRRLFLLAGAILGFVGVVLGAWGAHGMPDVLAEIYGNRMVKVGGSEMAASAKYRGDFLTGVRYQMTHAVVLVAMAGLPRTLRYLFPAAICFIAGSVFFSGSLYALVLTATPWLGAITPIGGLLLLVGWGCLAAAAITTPRHEHLND